MSNVIKAGTRVAVAFNETASEGACVFYAELVSPICTDIDPLIVRMEPSGLLFEINPRASSFEGISEAPREPAP